MRHDTSLHVKSGSTLHGASVRFLSGLFMLETVITGFTSDYSLCTLFYFYVLGVQMKDGTWMLRASNRRYG